MDTRVTLNRVVNTLQSALDVMTDASNPDGQGYAYASGYARGSMNQAIDELCDLLDSMEPIRYRVTEVQFDFQDEDFELPVQQQLELIQDCKNTVWTVDEESELVDVITDHYGWCVQSIEYEEQGVPVAEPPTIHPFFP